MLNTRGMIIFSHYLDIQNDWIESEKIRVNCPFHKENDDDAFVTRFYPETFRCRKCDLWLEKDEFIQRIEKLDKKDKKKLRNIKDEILKKYVPKVSIKESSNSIYDGKPVQSNVQVIQSDETGTKIPRKIILHFQWGNESKWEKIKEWKISKENNKILFSFNTSKKFKDQAIKNLMDIENQKYLYIMKNNILDDNLTMKNAKSMIKVRIEIKHHTVYKNSVKDYLHSGNKIGDDGYVNSRLNIYTFDNPLQNGNAYNIIYVTYPNEYANNVVEGISWGYYDSNDRYSTFSVDTNTKHILKKFQKNNDIMDLYKQYKSYTANYIPLDLFLFNEIVTHSALEVKYGNNIERGVIHASIIGDTRVGKSESITKALEKYNYFGGVINLRDTSEVGLKGAATKNPNGFYSISSGVLTEKNKKMVVLEEVHSAKFDYHKSITQVKSSGVVSIRKGGASQEQPALLRILEISNPKMVVMSRGIVESIDMDSFNTGIDIIKNLIPNGEDIARQDMFLCMWANNNHISRSDRSDMLEPFTNEEYEIRRLWCWTRKPNQIIFEEGVEAFIEQKGMELNNEYPLKEQIFGREIDKKIMRISVALAGMLVSTDETYENIVITKQLVQFATDFLISLYDNPKFNIRKFIDTQQKSIRISAEDKEEFEILKNHRLKVIQELGTNSNLTLDNLRHFIGEDRDEQDRVIQTLMTHKFITNADRFGPLKTTYKFKKLYNKLPKKYKNLKIGDK